VDLPDNYNFGRTSIRTTALIHLI